MLSGTLADLVAEMRMAEVQLAECVEERKEKRKRTSWSVNFFRLEIHHFLLHIEDLPPCDTVNGPADWCGVRIGIFSHEGSSNRDWVGIR